MTAWPVLRMAPLALSIRYSVRLLSNSGVAGEFRYFGPSPSSSRPPSPTRVAVLVADREDHPGPELVVDAAATGLARRGESDLEQLLGPDVALRAEGPRHLVPSAGSPAELVGRDRLVGEPAAVEVLEGGRTGGRVGQHCVVEGDRAVEDGSEPRLVRVLVLRPLVDLDAGALGEDPEGLWEPHGVALHDEAEDVATKAAAEAVPALPRGSDDERRCLLAVERTEALVGRARLLQADRLADDVDDGQSGLHFGCDTDRQTAPPGAGHGCGPVKS